MNKYFTLYKIEQRLFLRNPDVIIFNLCMPVGTFMIIALIAGKQVANIQGMTYLQSSFAALTTVGICCSAFMSIPIVFVDYRDKKILKHFYTSPCSPFVLLCVDVLCSLVMSILSAILIFIVASLFYGYKMEGNWLLFILSWFLTMSAMFSIGLLMGSLCRNVKSLNVVTSLVYFPMLFLSGATIPFELFPQELQFISQILPLTQGIQLMKAISIGQSIQQGFSIVLLLITITIICTTIAVKTFRWE